MIRSASLSSSRRLATVVLVLAACALAGCGRKGPLDLPPGASAEQSGYTQNSRDSDTNALGGSSSSRGGGPIVAPKGPNKRIPLDALLD